MASQTTNLKLGVATAVALSIFAPISATASDTIIPLIDANTAAIAENTAAIADLPEGLGTANKGLAMANAMDVFAPDPGARFRLNLGSGFSDDESAFGVTASGRVGSSASTILYLGVAASRDTKAGKAGVSFQW